MVIMKARPDEFIGFASQVLENIPGTHHSISQCSISTLSDERATGAPREAIFVA